jgi:hypothetical protein
LADFMRIDRDLIAVAGERSAEARSSRQLDRRVAALPAETKSDLLARFAAGDSQAAQPSCYVDFGTAGIPRPGPRRGSCPREVSGERLAKREAQTWRRVEALVATRKQSDYDEAVRLLKDLNGSHASATLKDHAR